VQFACRELSTCTCVPPKIGGCCRKRHPKGSKGDVDSFSSQLTDPEYNYVYGLCFLFIFLIMLLLLLLSESYGMA